MGFTLTHILPCMILTCCWILCFLMELYCQVGITFSKSSIWKYIMLNLLLQLSFYQLIWYPCFYASAKQRCYSHSPLAPGKATKCLIKRKVPDKPTWLEIALQLLARYPRQSTLMIYGFWSFCELVTVSKIMPSLRLLGLYKTTGYQEFFGEYKFSCVHFPVYFAASTDRVRNPILHLIWGHFLSHPSELLCRLNFWDHTIQNVLWYFQGETITYWGSPCINSSYISIPNVY